MLVKSCLYIIYFAVNGGHNVCLLFSPLQYVKNGHLPIRNDGSDFFFFVAFYTSSLTHFTVC